MTATRLAIAGLVFAAVAAPAGAQPPRMAPQRPTIAVNGEATVRRAPDRAFVTLATESRASDPDDAQAANAKAMNQVRDGLRRAGIPADAIRTMAFNLREDVDWIEGKRVPRGYVVTNALEVRVDNLDALGALLDDAVDAGATSVSGIRFDLRERESAEREALRLAVADARARADAAAAGANVRIVQIQSIEEQGGERPVPPPMPMMRMEAAADAPETPIAAGEIEIQAFVRLTAVVQGQ